MEIDPPPHAKALPPLIDVSDDVIVAHFNFAYWIERNRQFNSTTTAYSEDDSENSRQKKRVDESLEAAQKSRFLSEIPSAYTMRVIKECALQEAKNYDADPHCHIQVVKRAIISAGHFRGSPIDVFAFAAHRPFIYDTQIFGYEALGGEQLSFATDLKVLDLSNLKTTPEGFALIKNKLQAVKKISKLVIAPPLSPQENIDWISFLPLGVLDTVEVLELTNHFDFNLLQRSQLHTIIYKMFDYALPPESIISKLQTIVIHHSGYQHRAMDDSTFYLLGEHLPC